MADGENFRTVWPRCDFFNKTMDRKIINFQCFSLFGNLTLSQTTNRIATCLRQNNNETRSVVLLGTLTSPVQKPMDMTSISNWELELVSYATPRHILHPSCKVYSFLPCTFIMYFQLTVFICSNTSFFMVRKQRQLIIHHSFSCCLAVVLKIARSTGFWALIPEFEIFIAEITNFLFLPL